jgi:hypothetical protein
MELKNNPPTLCIAPGGYLRNPYNGIENRGYCKDEVALRDAVESIQWN